MKNDKNDGVRIAISTFIVGTTFTVIATKFSISAIFHIPAGAFLLALVVTAVLASLFILSKGYELRYGNRKNNFIDKNNHALYNLAMTAYAIVGAIVFLTFLYDLLTKLSKAGNHLATFIVFVIFLAMIAVVNHKDFKGPVIGLMRWVKRQ